VTRRHSRLEPELEAFLASGKVERTLPAELRDRVLLRARSVVSGRGVGAARNVVPAARPPEAARGAGGLIRIAFAASVAVAVGAAGAVAALRTRAPHAEDAPPLARLAPLAATPQRAAVAATPALAPDAFAAAPPTTTSRPSAPVLRHGRAGRNHGDDPFKAELALLQPAHVAYANGDFVATLKTLAEHARAFPQGRLAEEREALRVESLRQLGRGEEARGAASAFAKRFPNSILLARVREGQQP